MALLQIGLLLLLVIGLRSVGLGYSDFQGDEINALCWPSDFETPVDLARHLLDQRKGPVEFVITCAVGLINPGFTNELIVRLPFAAAGILAAVLFVLLVRRWFGFRPAMLAGALFATNGLLIAFSRFVQYQSFVMLATMLSLWLATLALDSEAWRIGGLYLSLLAASLGLLTHFDAVFVVPPLMLLVGAWWLRYGRSGEVPHATRHVLLAGGVSLALVAAFYVPYAARLGSFQIDYWADRFTGDPTNTLSLFGFYNPGPATAIYLIGSLLGILSVRRKLSWGLVLAWLLPPLAFMELIFSDSRTHVYTYLLPLILLAGIGFDGLLSWADRHFDRIVAAAIHGLTLLSLLILAWTSYGLLIDPEPEYPWNPKQAGPWQVDGGYLAGTFGFPYWRDWDGIRTWFRTETDRPYVVTNEKVVISTYYLLDAATVQYRARQLPPAATEASRIYFLLVEHPQSWLETLWGWPIERWHRELSPVHTFRDERGDRLATVYALTQEDIARLFP